MSSSIHCYHDWSTADTSPAAQDSDSLPGIGTGDSADDGNTDTNSTSVVDSSCDTATGESSGTQGCTEGGSDKAPAIELSFMEKIKFYRSYSSHDILVGPPTSLNPEEKEGKDWTLVADGNAMNNAMANEVWVKGVRVDLSAWAGETIRIALRYRGTMADHWFVDDLCISTRADAVFPQDCDVFAEDFSSSKVGQIPYGWSEAAGDQDDGVMHWTTSNAEAFSGTRSAWAWSYLIATELYLVSAPIDLPAVAN